MTTRTLDARQRAAIFDGLRLAARLGGTPGQVPLTPFKGAIVAHYFPDADHERVCEGLIASIPGLLTIIDGHCQIDSSWLPAAEGRPPLPITAAELDVLTENVRLDPNRPYTTDDLKRVLRTEGKVETPAAPEKADSFAVPEADPVELRRQAFANHLQFETVNGKPLPIPISRQVVGLTVPEDEVRNFIRTCQNKGRLVVKDGSRRVTSTGRDFMGNTQPTLTTEDVVARLQEWQSELTPTIEPEPMAAEPKPTATEPEPTATEPDPQPSGKENLVDTQPETSALAKRILDDLGRLIRIKKEAGKEDKLEDDESLKVTMRYITSRKKAQEFRSRLVNQLNLLKNVNADSKDGRARWYDPYVGPLKLRHFERDVATLEQVKPLTDDEGKVIIGIEARAPTASPPEAETPPTEEDAAEVASETSETVEALSHRIFKEIALMEDENSGALTSGQNLSVYLRYFKEVVAFASRSQHVHKGRITKTGTRSDARYTLNRECLKLRVVGTRAVSQARLDKVPELTAVMARALLGKAVGVIHELPSAPESARPTASALVAGLQAMVQGTDTELERGELEIGDLQITRRECEELLRQTDANIAAERGRQAERHARKATLEAAIKALS